MDVAPVDDWAEQLVENLAHCKTYADELQIARVWICQIIKYMEHKKEQSCQENQSPKN